jgi:hypothetical protein
MSEKVFCNDLQPGRKIRIKTKAGAIEDHKIIKMIPMQRMKDGFLGEIDDIEILLKKKKNIYFSYTMYLEGKSWVSEIVVLKKSGGKSNE